jgi:ADP-ribosylation factor GTPase-activating protein 2/3
MSNGPTDGTSTPSGDPEDDFFSSWDKPSIKRPTPPVSRTATPPVVGRTPSPFLNAGSANGNGNGIARSASPLASSESAPPAASRTTSSAALRKGAAVGSGPRKANVLGAKKTKLGAKKVTADVIDFDAAERKAKEEAERIAKLGYDPDAEAAESKKPATTTKTADLPKIASPTPVSPSRSGYGSGQQRERTNSELERLGMGMGRLGFGQIGGAKPAAAPKKMGGFGSVGPIKATQEGQLCLNITFQVMLTISQMTMRNMLDKSSAPRRVSHQTNSSAKEPSILMRNPKPSKGYKDSRVPSLSPRTHTSDVQMNQMPEKNMEIWRALQRIS